jgi:hypothetical protein
MLFIHVFANMLPLNKITTSQASDLYFNLFTPARLTSFIEVVIYILFAAYILYQFGFLKKGVESIDAVTAKKIEMYFIIAAFVNILWTFAWHYGKIALSMGLIATVMMCMSIIGWKIHKQELTVREKIFVKLPFSIFFSCTTVAAIANITTFLVGVDWGSFELSREVWTVIGISIGMLVGSAVIVINKDIAYGMGLLWAYVGILVKHISVFGFAGKYPLIINTVNVCIILIVVFQAHVFFSSRVKEMRR